MTQYLSRFEEARSMALADPSLSQAEIARRVGLSRQGVSIALNQAGIRVRNARGDHLRNRRRNAISDARRKAETRQPLTREERHLLWQDYRRREREDAA